MDGEVPVLLLSCIDGQRLRRRTRNESGTARFECVRLGEVQDSGGEAGRQQVVGSGSGGTDEKGSSAQRAGVAREEELPADLGEAQATSRTEGGKHRLKGGWWWWWVQSEAASLPDPCQVKRSKIDLKLIFLFNAA